MPENPDAGVYLLDTGGKGSFSKTSVFAQKQQKGDIREVIAMNITQTPSGNLILDQIHPIISQWVPEKIMRSLEKAKKDFKECLVYNNINGKYRFLFNKTTI